MSSFISPSRFLSFQYNIYKEKKCIVEKTPPQKKNKTYGYWHGKNRLDKL